MRLVLILIGLCATASLAASPQSENAKAAEKKEKPAVGTAQISSSQAKKGAFYCHQQPIGGWVGLRGGESQAVYLGTTLRRYRIANQPALNRPTQLIATFDGQDIEVPPVPAAVDVEGKNIVVKNTSTSQYKHEFCWMSVP